MLPSFLPAVLLPLLLYPLSLAKPFARNLQWYFSLDLKENKEIKLMYIKRLSLKIT